MHFRLRALVCALSILLGFSVAASAQDYPNRPVRIIVPFPAGGGTDALSRILAEALSQRFGHRFIVENIPGSGGNLGANRVAHADPDGHALLIGTMGILSVNPLVYRNVGGAIVDKLVPVSLVFESGHIIIAHPGVNATTLDELSELAKAEQGQLTYASGGIGSSTHLYAELFNLLRGSSMNHVAYRGNGPALQDVIAGHVKVMFDQIGNSAEQARAGAVRAIAVTTPSRLAMLPKVPTVVEAGMPQLAGTSWTMLLAPAKTPQSILDTLNTAISEITKDATIRGRMESIGASAKASTAMEAAALIRSELERWKPVVEKAGIQSN